MATFYFNSAEEPALTAMRLQELRHAFKTLYVGPLPYRHPGMKIHITGQMPVYNPNLISPFQLDHAEVTAIGTDLVWVKVKKFGESDYHRYCIALPGNAPAAQQHLYGDYEVSFITTLTKE